jgi:hypothetical protein
MAVSFAGWFEVQIRATAQKMAIEKLDVCEIPEGAGMKLLRHDSDECRRRLAIGPKSISMPMPIVIDGCLYVVGACSQDPEPAGQATEDK